SNSDLPSMPPSRRSSMSVGSALDGQIDAWEGFADDSPDESIPDDLVVADVAAAEQAGPLADEQLVTAALEQSLVGTLSASRSSSLGVSSTAVSSSETHCITDDDSNSPMTTAFPGDVLPLATVKDESGDHLRASPIYPGPPGASACLLSRDFAQWLLSIIATGGILLSYKEQSQTNCRCLPSWTLLDIPAVRTLRLIKDSESQIVVDSVETRKMVDPQFVYRELCPLLSPQAKKSFGVLSITFVALLSLIMGFAPSTQSSVCLRWHPLRLLPLLSLHTHALHVWNMFGTTSNSSVAPLATAPPTGSVAIMPHDDFSPGRLDLAAPSTSSGACRSGTTGSPVGECKQMTWPEKGKSTKDVILRPSTALSTHRLPSTVHTPSVGGNMGKVSALPIDKSAPVTSLSLKLVDSLSEVVDSTMKALEEVVGRDFKELMGALDDLMRAIGRQAAMIATDSKSRAQILRERESGELKEMGEQFVSRAGERLKARAEIAKTRAHSRDRKRERRVGSLFAKLKERRDNRKQRVVT
ncbi:hypothetical protein DFH06DRAFT_1256108, partial [Mycena polygramma]